MDIILILTPSKSGYNTRDQEPEEKAIPDASTLSAPRDVNPTPTVIALHPLPYPLALLWPAKLITKTNLIQPAKNLEDFRVLIRMGRNFRRNRMR